MKKILFILTLCALTACSGEGKQSAKSTSVEVKKQTTVKRNTDSLTAKYGEQWDFCHCVKVGDSINKALQSSKLSSSAFQRLSDRFDVVEQKCKAFRIEDPNRTPDERSRHKVKVNKCLE